MSRHLEPNATIPDFELPDENGVMHRLSELQGGNLMVVHVGAPEARAAWDHSQRLGRAA